MGGHSSFAWARLGYACFAVNETPFHFQKSPGSDDIWWSPNISGNNVPQPVVPAFRSRWAVGPL